MTVATSQINAVLSLSDADKRIMTGVIKEKYGSLLGKLKARSSFLKRDVRSIKFSTSDGVRTSLPAYETSWIKEQVTEQVRAKISSKEAQRALKHLKAAFNDRRVFGDDMRKKYSGRTSNWNTDCYSAKDRAREASIGKRNVKWFAALRGMGLDYDGYDGLRVNYDRLNGFYRAAKDEAIVEIARLDNLIEQIGIESRELRLKLALSRLDTKQAQDIIDSIPSEISDIK